MKLWNIIQRAIDLLVELMGRIGWVLVLYCMVFGVTDVFLRYVMNAPSLWIGTTIQAAMVLMACVGGAYALNHNAFVKLDLFYANFSKKKKAACDILTVGYTFLFLYVLIWKGYAAALLSIKLQQVTPTGVPIPIYPIKVFIPIAGCIVLLVVIKKLINDIITLASSDKQGEK